MKKLVLFDIDGTLVLGKKNGVKRWQLRVGATVREVFNVTLRVLPSTDRFNGWVDKKLFWTLASENGISRDHFLKQFPKVRDVFHRLTKLDIESNEVGYRPIPDAIRLVQKLRTTEQVGFGLITGNISLNGWLKLKSAGIRDYFSFGVFADEVEERHDLAQAVFEESKKHFGKRFAPYDVVVIGDTKFDVRAGKSIGAKTIAVLTGLTETRKSLAEENPDLLVESLMDAKVLTLLGLV